ncbi:MAG: hypothetical protein QGG84_12420, partial [Rhodospirillales bacterium]|nr:hypothetical protein [Rhodospirillales bacterium]
LEQRHHSYGEDAGDDATGAGEDDVYGEVAYLPGSCPGMAMQAHVVHAADGESLIAADSYSLAAAMVIQNDLMPVSAH